MFRLARNLGATRIVDWNGEMNTDRKRPSAATLEPRSRAAWHFAFGLLVSASVCASACSSKETPAPTPDPTLGDCDGRAPDALNAGNTYTSDGGYAFELMDLDPSMPVQSDSAPGNHWTVKITDPFGASVTGGACLTITTLMPDHGHSGPPAVGVETIEGSGVYDVTDLRLTMPTLFTVSFVLTVPAPGSGECGSKDFVAATTETAALMLCLEAASG
jgi:hypothetical protein